MVDLCTRRRSDDTNRPTYHEIGLVSPIRRRMNKITIKKSILIWWPKDDASSQREGGGGLRRTPSRLLSHFCGLGTPTLTSDTSASVASHRAEMELMLLTRCARKAAERACVHHIPPIKPTREAREASKHRRRCQAMKAQQRD